MTRLFSSALTAFALITATPALANHHCTCDEKCAQECQKGKSDNCNCKNCACAKGEDCKHGKCNRHQKH